MKSAHRRLAGAVQALLLAIPIGSGVTQLGVHHDGAEERVGHPRGAHFAVAIELGVQGAASTLSAPRTERITESRGLEGTRRRVEGGPVDESTGPHSRSPSAPESGRAPPGPSH
jgi:hypothetical protein